ncbi:hypothetical protein HOT57_gp23 [Pseudomonas phage phCDa]|uniref:Uncharacterized protein n=1 Tax=Pseudomonas phage phCDa TaxID=2268587 RepID=A0A2Z5H9T2_9CAUD|nr:hypothetical protein HOT57_gp23 [Pseudomonas phage phCDa]AXC36467.1 hypothetical protein phCDa_23 [Pseudomonas phage phCDa]
MTEFQYRRVDKPYKYIAAQMGSTMEPLPHWFRSMVELGLMRFDSDGNVEVTTITGAWALVMPGDWVVVQRRDKDQGWLTAQFMIFHVEHEDFIKVWEKV